LCAAVSGFLDLDGTPPLTAAFAAFGFTARRTAFLRGAGFLDALANTDDAIADSPAKMPSF
jgi:hypothetical protein